MHYLIQLSKKRELGLAIIALTMTLILFPGPGYAQETAVIKTGVPDEAGEIYHLKYEQNGKIIKEEWDQNKDGIIDVIMKPNPQEGKTNSFIMLTEYKAKKQWGMNQSNKEQSRTQKEH